MSHLIPAIFSVIDESDSYPMTFADPVGHVDIINLSTANVLTVTFTQPPNSFAIPISTESTFSGWVNTYSIAISGTSPDFNIALARKDA